eukprot:TRINITY_DN6958_c1_g1_i4.p1 TRINITY_DN6958_c1_g1~~TRINITY_DN6958_c1_g1_i4.p1  ORF type:complete len:1585 (+),score=399.23 TRINITY_DN6958_c1_g1_i4:78-4832(+)
MGDQVDSSFVVPARPRGLSTDSDFFNSLRRGAEKHMGSNSALPTTNLSASPSSSSSESQSSSSDDDDDDNCIVSPRSKIIAAHHQHHRAMKGGSARIYRGKRVGIIEEEVEAGISGYTRRSMDETRYASERPTSEPSSARSSEDTRRSCEKFATTLAEQQSDDQQLPQQQSQQQQQQQPHQLLTNTNDDTHNTNTKNNSSTLVDDSAWLARAGSDPLLIPTRKQSFRGVVDQLSSSAPIHTIININNNNNTSKNNNDGSNDNTDPINHNQSENKPIYHQQQQEDTSNVKSADVTSQQQQQQPQQQQHSPEKDNITKKKNKKTKKNDDNSATSTGSVSESVSVSVSVTASADVSGKESGKESGSESEREGDWLSLVLKYVSVAVWAVLFYSASVYSRLAGLVSRPHDRPPLSTNNNSNNNTALLPPSVTTTPTTTTATAAATTVTQQESPGRKEKREKREKKDKKEKKEKARGESKAADAPSRKRTQTMDENSRNSDVRGELSSSGTLLTVGDMIRSPKIGSRRRALGNSGSGSVVVSGSNKSGLGSPVTGPRQKGDSLPNNIEMELRKAMALRSRSVDSTLASVPEEGVAEDNEKEIASASTSAPNLLDVPVQRKRGGSLRKTVFKGISSNHRASENLGSLTNLDKEPASSVDDDNTNPRSSRSFIKNTATHFKSRIGIRQRSDSTPVRCEATDELGMISEETEQSGASISAAPGQMLSSSGGAMGPQAAKARKAALKKMRIASPMRTRLRRRSTSSEDETEPYDEAEFMDDLRMSSSPDEHRRSSSGNYSVGIGGGSVTVTGGGLSPVDGGSSSEDLTGRDDRDDVSFEKVAVKSLRESLQLYKASGFGSGSVESEDEYHILDYDSTAASPVGSPQLNRSLRTTHKPGTSIDKDTARLLSDWKEERDKEKERDIRRKVPRSNYDVPDSTRGDPSNLDSGISGSPPSCTYNPSVSVSGGYNVRYSKREKVKKDFKSVGRLPGSIVRGVMTNAMKAGSELNLYAAAKRADSNNTLDAEFADQILDPATEDVSGSANPSPETTNRTSRGTQESLLIDQYIPSTVVTDFLEYEQLNSEIDEELRFMQVEEQEEKKETLKQYEDFCWHIISGEGSFERKKHRQFMKKCYRSFPASAVVTWLLTELGLTRSQAIAIGRGLVDSRFMHAVSKGEDFVDDPKRLFRLQWDSKVAAYCLNLRRICIVTAASPASTVKQLNRTLNQLLGTYWSEVTQLVDTEALKQSRLWYDFNNAVAELQRLSFHRLHPRKMVTFFLNVYHLLLVHAQLANGVPQGSVSRFKLFNDQSYRLQGASYTLTDMIHGMIKGDIKRCHDAQKHSYFWKSAKLATHDRKFAYALRREQCDPALNFMVHGGAALRKELKVSKRRPFVPCFSWRQLFGERKKQLSSPSEEKRGCFELDSSDDDTNTEDAFVSASLKGTRMDAFGCPIDDSSARLSGVNVGSGEKGENAGEGNDNDSKTNNQSDSGDEGYRESLLTRVVSEVLHAEVVFSYPRREVFLPKVFKWNYHDFGNTDSDLLRFLIPYYSENSTETTSARKFIQSGRFTVKYNPFDWSTLGMADRLPLRQKSSHH